MSEANTHEANNVLVTQEDTAGKHMTATASKSQKRINEHRRALTDERSVLKLLGRMMDERGAVIGHYFAVASASRPGSAHLVKAFKRGFRDYQFVCDQSCQRYYYERTCIHTALVERWFIDSGHLDDPLEDANGRAL